MKLPRIAIFGAGGLAGRAILEALQSSGNNHWEILTPGSKDVNLLDWRLVSDYLKSTKPNIVINSAARVGGISFNESRQAEQAFYNSRILLNLLEASDSAKIPNLFSVSSSCVYPSLAERPYKETDLYFGKGESTNEGYSIAKMLAIRLIDMKFNQEGKNWVNVISTNLFGTNDKFNIDGHLVGSAIHRVRTAIRNKQDRLVFRGTGTAIREFMYSKDLGYAVRHLIENQPSFSTFNVTNGENRSVAQIIREITVDLGYRGEVQFAGGAKEDGNPDKRLDGARMLELGWRHKYSFEAGLSEVLKNRSS